MVITGIWKCNDGGTYYVRQIGKIVWWMGISNDGGNLFTNVFRGKIQESQIDGEWTDVPRGSILNNGTLALRIIMDSDKNASNLQKISASGGFSGSAWQKLKQ